MGEPLFPNLKSLVSWSTIEEFIPFIPSLLSPTTTVIDINFNGYTDAPNAAIASTVTTFPALCPNLRKIRLHHLPRDPIITDAVSELLLNINRDALRHLHLDSPLTEEVREVVYKLPDLCELWVAIEGSTSLPTMVLPNLTKIHVKYDHNRNWLQGFRGATFGKLNSVTFDAESPSAQVDDFLEEFQSSTLTTSTRHTLSEFHLRTWRSWSPNYSSLLGFKQLTKLEIRFSCRNSCSSRADDDVIIDLAQAMPKLEVLELGGAPCGTPTGVTFKGLIALACRCPQLSELCIHFRVDSLIEATTSGEPASPSEHAAATPQTNCALTQLYVGKICIPEGSASAVALILFQVFPHILSITYSYDNQEWGGVRELFKVFKKLGDGNGYTSETHLSHLRRSLVTPCRSRRGRFDCSLRTATHSMGQDIGSAMRLNTKTAKSGAVN
jgi:hypothetical protein